MHVCSYMTRFSWLAILRANSISTYIQDGSQRTRRQVKDQLPVQASRLQFLPEAKAEVQRESSTLQDMREYR
jgi:hypothetical protein